MHSVANMANLGAFQRFLRLCAGWVGQPLNLHALATEAGILLPTIRKWLTLFEASFIAFLLQPWFENYAKRIVKSSKLYFYDTGLLCHLLDLHAANALQHFYARASLFENMVAAERMKKTL